MTKASPFDLTGQVAVITGSSRGIGRSIAETLAQLGAKVVVSSRKAEACEPVAAGIKAAGGEAIVIPANISKKVEVEALVAKTVEHYGRLDIMVANAAVSPYFGLMMGLDDEAFDKTINSNVRSALWLARLAHPHMKKQGAGSVVIVSSIAGLRHGANIGMYGISKAADFSLARSLAAEWGPDNIRVNCIAPGLVKTDMARALWEDDKRRKAVEATTPLRRLGNVEDIAGCAAFLASRASAYVTGQVIVADGGVTVV
jgi:NAD(P)-dependent dehydrogenase (short-subunit alcohol dehydrogenase family)